MWFLNVLNLFRLKLFKSNLVIFILFSILWTLIAEKLPARIYNYKKWLYRERKWEKGGKIYESLFQVRRWKSFLPDIGDFLKWRFSKKHLDNSNTYYLHRFILESCKSEFTHWMIILSSFLFLFWGGLLACLKIFVLSVVLNLPYIIIQRYNRPRLIRLLRKNECQDLELATAKA